MARLRHLAITAADPDGAAAFYVDVLGFRRVRELRARWGYGHVVTDGTLSVSILRYLDAAAAGLERGTGFFGLHHIGFEVADVDAMVARLGEAGAALRSDISGALGIPPQAPIREFEGPDGVVLDLGGPGTWTRDLSRRERS